MFMNEVVESIQKRQMEKFRKKYRQVDVLIIDDIQFLA
jgi:chromosomal replication initiator protein